MHIFCAGTITSIANYHAVLQVRQTTATFHLASCVIINYTLHAMSEFIEAAMRISGPTVYKVMLHCDGKSLRLLRKRHRKRPVLH